MSSIVLTTLNARWAHASLGLRYLRANLGDLRADSALCEFTLAAPAQTVVERLLDQTPRLIGFGVYIWNVEHTTRVIELLKVRAPAVTVVVGGPEVSHEVDAQRICRLADFVITGWGDVTFAKLARQVLHGPRPLMKLHAGEQPPLHDIAAPYDEYTVEDLRHRHVYVEARAVARSSASSACRLWIAPHGRFRSTRCSPRSIGCIAAARATSASSTARST